MSDLDPEAIGADAAALHTWLCERGCNRDYRVMLLVLAAETSLVCQVITRSGGDGRLMLDAAYESAKLGYRNQAVARYMDGVVGYRAPEGKA